MRELRVPKAVESPFKAHFRDLVLGSLLRGAHSEAEEHRERGHRLRARRAAMRAERIRSVALDGGIWSLPEVTAATRSWGPVSPVLRGAVRVAWLVAAAGLAVGVVAYGVDSWATGAADLALIALTFAWFASGVGDLAPAVD